MREKNPHRIKGCPENVSILLLLLIRPGSMPWSADRSLRDLGHVKDGSGFPQPGIGPYLGQTLYHHALHDIGDYKTSHLAVVNKGHSVGQFWSVNLRARQDCQCTF
ncbi:hypothetical protein RRG08_058476 [Elysia crispata]|uniref:Uncharacterized protein n=1 Tax=Elysia crispata TaxID=231223 RepID=A0AAE0Y623_9GAST|nr:hypothetical protein RRG08_058476 [Elysia crispata]